MRFWKFLIAACLLLSSPVDARPRGGAASAAGLVGKGQLGLGNSELQGQAVTNLFLASSMNFASGATPAPLDAFGFPVRNFTGQISGGVSQVSGQTLTTGPWKLSWDAGRSCFKWFISNRPGVASNIVNATITNGAGSGNFTVQGNCSQAGSVTITLNSAGGSFVWQWDDAYAQYNSNTTGRMWLSRSTNVGWNGLSDDVAFQAGTYWSKEFVNQIVALKPESIRPMAWNLLHLQGETGTNVVNWSYRMTTSALTFSTITDYPPGIRCGGATSYCTMTVSNGAVTTAAAADTSLAGWVDGEQITGNMGSLLPQMTATAIANNGGKCQFTVADTTGLSPGAPVATFGGSVCNIQLTTILTVDSATQFTTNQASNGTCASSFCVAVGYQSLTVTGKSGGSKLILGLNGTPLSTNFSAGFVTFTYNAVLDKVIITGGGISNSPPIEAQAQLANLVNANLWFNFPTWANDGFVTGSANAIYSSLNSNLKTVFELSNEFFNFGQNAAQYSIQMGTALGITTNNSWTWQGLRTRQIHGNLLPASNWSAATSRMDRTFCSQSGGDFTPITQAMGGNSLVSPGTAAYQAYVGGSAVNYNTSPNRPIDFTNSICYAPYTGGGIALSELAPDSHSVPTANDATFLNALGAAVGTPATSNALIDQSVRGDYRNRVQNVTASGTSFTTPLAHNYVVGDMVSFQVTGGTSYSGLVLPSLYKILSVPTSATFTAGQCVAQIPGTAVNAGSAGSGTTTVGWLASDSVGRCYSSNTIFSMLSGPFTKFQLIATTGWSPASALGAPGVRQYEASLEVMPPTVSTCTAIGVTTSYCGPSGDIATTILNWKNSSFASDTMQYFLKNQMGTQTGTITFGAMPNSISPSWLILNGGGVYGLTSGFDLISPSPYQLYNGYQAFSAN